MLSVLHGLAFDTYATLLPSDVCDVRTQTCPVDRHCCSSASMLSAGENVIVAHPCEALHTPLRRLPAPTAVWEVFTAEQLYEGLTVGQVLYAVAYSGSRPTVPPGCPPRYAEVMEACWCSEPADRRALRPRFSSQSRRAVGKRFQQLPMWVSRQSALTVVNGSAQAGLRADHQVAAAAARGGAPDAETRLLVRHVAPQHRRRRHHIQHSGDAGSAPGDDLLECSGSWSVAPSASIADVCSDAVRSVAVVRAAGSV